MKAGIITHLRPGSLPAIKNSGIDTLLYFRMHAGVTTDSLPGIRLIPAGDGYVRASEIAWEGFRKKLLRVRKRFPEVMEFRGYDLEDSYCKGLHWRFQDQWLLEHAARLHLSEVKDIVRLDPAESSLKIRLRLAKLILQSLVRGRDPGMAPVPGAKGRLALMNTEMAMQDLWMGFPEAYGWENLLFYGTRQKHDPEIRAFAAGHGLPYFEFPAEGSRLHLSGSAHLRLLAWPDANFMFHVLSLRLKIISQILAYEHLARAGVSGFFTMAGENTSEGLTAGMVAQKFGLKSFNYLNGAKHRVMTNRHINFDYWFVHDEGMQQMLCECSGLSPAQFPVLGHLTEDKARNHSYSGSLDAFRSRWEGKRVLLLFGSPLYFNEQRAVAEVLGDFFDRHPDWVGLFRSHPRVKDPIYPKHSSLIRLPLPERDQVTESLFDLFSLGEVAISFASTVSFQSRWFPLLSINFELREKPTAEYVDGKTILHVTSPEKLRELLDDLPPAAQEPGFAPQSVAEKMSEFIRKKLRE